MVKCIVWDCGIVGLLEVKEFIDEIGFQNTLCNIRVYRGGYGTENLEILCEPFCDVVESYIR